MKIRIIEQGGQTIIKVVTTQSKDSMTVEDRAQAEGVKKLMMTAYHAGCVAEDLED